MAAGGLGTQLSLQKGQLGRCFRKDGAVPGEPDGLPASRSVAPAAGVSPAELQAPHRRQTQEDARRLSTRYLVLF